MFSALFWHIFGDILPHFSGSRSRRSLKKRICAVPDPHHCFATKDHSTLISTLSMHQFLEEKQNPSPVFGVHVLSPLKYAIFINVNICDRKEGFISGKFVPNFCNSK